MAPKRLLIAPDERIPQRLMNLIMKDMARALEEFWIYGPEGREAFVAWMNSCRAWKRRWYVPQ